MAKQKVTKEVTGSQSVSFIFGDGVLTRPNYALAGTLAQLRAIRKDPTVILARTVLVSAIQAGSWNIEADDDVPEAIVDDLQHLLDLRSSLIHNSVAFGKVDYGWMPFEKIFKVTDEGKLVVDSLKPLLHDITTILVTPQGKFDGYRQRPMSGLPVDLGAEKTLHMAFGVEAGNLYGVPLLENIRATSDSWGECNDGAKRYDTKIAGSHWVVYYPPGTSVIDGVSTDNGEVAALVLAAMKSSGSAAIPTTSATVLQEILNQSIADLYAWRVELIEDSGGKQKNFNDRLNYLDKQKVRGFGLPERSVLEGQFGTKAEAGTHGEWALLGLEAIDRNIIAQINSQVVNQLVMLNHGPEFVGKVRLVALPLVDKQIAFLRKVYGGLTDPNLDVATLAGRLDLPQADDGNPLPKKEENDEE
ncbi:hypothetical protein LCGC14_1248380 [marine sediment metagenome]|uniref:Phage portal protein n=1 Tax=marine sediment metagenome TaxID=412755 RepID=A0A0F9L3S8_9ZZZZ